MEGVQGLCVLIYKASNATRRVLLLLIDDWITSHSMHKKDERAKQGKKKKGVKEMLKMKNTKEASSE